MHYRVSSLLIAWRERDASGRIPKQAELAQFDEDLFNELNAAVTSAAVGLVPPPTPHVLELLAVLAANSDGASSSSKASAAVALLSPYAAAVAAEDSSIAGRGLVKPDALARPRKRKRSVGQPARGRGKRPAKPAGRSRRKKQA